MVTVMRQRSFYKPNGCRESYQKAKGCSGKKLMIFAATRPYRAKPDSHSGSTPSMKEVYKGLKVRQSDPAHKKTVRKLRYKLAVIKMPEPTAHASIGRKKNHAAHRPRCVVWPSEKNPVPRYRYDGTIKE